MLQEFIIRFFIGIGISLATYLIMKGWEKYKIEKGT